MPLIERLRSCVGFDWDEGNADKNWKKHRVSRGEAEQVFFQSPIIATDERYYALGQTERGRLLFVVFTIRGNLLRVISARDMTEAEREVYRA